jgi:ABC-type multidrug transport system ATPase subunit
MVTINIDQISKKYGRRFIFKKFSASLKANQRYGIAGRNGSGKSSLMKIISGYTTPSEGSIQYFANKKEILVEDVFKEISFIAPYTNVPVQLTWSELYDFHFSFQKTFQRLSKTDILTYFDLPSNIPISNFSSGMIQRVKLSLAFFSDTKILLLDEPTETLDEQGIQDFRTLLDRYTKDRIVVIASNKAGDFIDTSTIFSIEDFQS